MRKTKQRKLETAGLVSGRQRCRSNSLAIPPQWSQEATCFAESHAAAVKQTVIAFENAMGTIKRYLQLTIVMAAKERANAHAVPRMSASVAAGRPPNCQANIAAKR